MESFFSRGLVKVSLVATLLAGNLREALLVVVSGCLVKPRYGDRHDRPAK